MVKDITIKKEKGQDDGVEVLAPTAVRKRKRPLMESDEKVIKKEKMDAPPPTEKTADDMISKDFVKGRLSLMKKYLYDGWGAEMLMRSNMENLRRTMEGLEEKLD